MEVFEGQDDLGRIETSTRFYIVKKFLTGLHWADVVFEVDWTVHLRGSTPERNKAFFRFERRKQAWLRKDAGRQSKFGLENWNLQYQNISLCFDVTFLVLLLNFFLFEHLERVYFMIILFSSKNDFGIWTFSNDGKECKWINTDFLLSCFIFPILIEFFYKTLHSKGFLSLGNFKIYIEKI
jgi:hypothetical protein